MKKRKWLPLLLAACLMLGLVAPTKLFAQAATTRYTFHDLTYSTSYGTTYSVDSSGALNLTFEEQYMEIRYSFPTPLDMSTCNSITINAKAAEDIAFKLYDTTGEEAYVKYNCSGSSKTAFTLTPELSGRVSEIAIMQLAEVSNASVTVYDVSVEQSTSSGSSSGTVSSSANLLNTYGSLFGRAGNCVSLSQLQNSNTLAAIKAEYNSITLENEMKPDYILGSSATLISVADARALGYYIPSSYTEATIPKINFDTVDKVMKLCYENGLGMRAHTLVWHSQTPGWLFRTGYSSSGSYVSSSVMDARMEFFVKTVINHVYDSPYGSCVYAWDVVNEYFHASNSGWEAVYGAGGTTPGFVKKAFQFAHEALVNQGVRNQVSLFYNDYNTYMIADDIVTMVKYINSGTQYCDGIGMQSHLDTSFPSASYYNAALKKFCDTGLEVQITEFDVTNSGSAAQATYCYNLMSGVLDIKKAGGNITGFTVWGLYDSVSWRSGQTPTLHTSLTSTKAAYDSILQAYADAGYSTGNTPTATPKPTQAPTATPTVTPKPTQAPTAAPTATPKPTQAPTAAPTATPKPTQAPTPSTGSGSISASIKSVNNWGSGGQVELTLKNEGASLTGGWSIALDLDSATDISNSWGDGYVYSSANGHLVIKNQSWVSSFAGGTTKSVFLQYNGTAPTSVSNVTVK